MIYDDAYKRIRIEADSIEIGNKVSFGTDISIFLRGQFRIGDYSYLGNDVQIRGNNVIIGKHLYHTSGLRVGRGGESNPTANLLIGDRCTIHDNILNICEPIEIGNDVGLSNEVTLLTHGYWLSVLEGYPASFSGIKIGNGVIVGYRSLIMPGVTISDNTVIGAQSVVTNSIWGEPGIYAGSPARFIRAIIPLTSFEKIKKLGEILRGYFSIADYHGVSPHMGFSYPILFFKKFGIDVETFKYWGEEDEDTDDFRDYIRKWGIRIYTERPFRSKYVCQ
jgi:acetyltransferase-like isoleucine patch superfamily enzyme